jgi:predicted nucleic acid-binding protein
MVFGESPAAEVVKDLFEAKNEEPSSIHISWINLGEVFYNVVRRKGTDEAEAVINDLLMLSIKPHEPSKNDILAAARFKATYRLSYADAFVVALAQGLSAVVYTGDPEILDMKDVISVYALERHQH